MSCSSAFISSLWINVGKGLRASMLIRRPEVRGTRGTFGCGEEPGFVFALAHPPVYVARLGTLVLGCRSLREGRDLREPPAARCRSIPELPGGPEHPRPPPAALRPRSARSCAPRGRGKRGPAAALGASPLQPLLLEPPLLPSRPGHSFGFSAGPSELAVFYPAFVSPCKLLKWLLNNPSKSPPPF